MTYKELKTISREIFEVQSDRAKYLALTLEKISKTAYPEEGDDEDKDEDE